MPKSLQDSISQPTHTKAVIQASMKSPEGANRVWCVVESDEDIEVYEKFFISYKVSVLPSTNENGKRSFRNVETIVTQLYKEETNPYVFGIRDKDYSLFISSYTCPDNVFMTDDRDLEMMMFRAPNVIADLNSRNPNYPETIAIGQTTMRFLGYLRILNAVEQLSCTFKDKLEKVSLVWNHSTHSIFPDYKERLFSKFQEQTHVSRMEFDNFVLNFGLHDMSLYDICRGHDVCRMVCTMMIKQEFSKTKDLFKWMTDAYTLSDFEHTSLYLSICDWASNRGLSIFP